MTAEDVEVEEVEVEVEDENEEDDDDEDEDGDDEEEVVDNGKIVGIDVVVVVNGERTRKNPE